MEQELSRQIERLGWGLLILSTLITLPVGMSQVGGMVVGGLFSLLNFRWMRAFWERLFTRRWQQWRRIEVVSALGYLGKYLLITVLFFYIIKYQLVDLLFFLLGLSIIVVAIIGAGIRQTVTRKGRSMWRS
ncbi:MAG: ATP synthase subunit I [Nitrospinota bacterium]|nr:MAG: ATP synthase subunit I [Nitrospinota bacterium]